MQEPFTTPLAALQRIAEIEKKLEVLGISPEKAHEALQHFDEYMEAKDALAKGREQQFHEDAYELARRMSAASNKNVTLLAFHLRAFAEHVATHILRAVNQEATPSRVADLVDPIPLLFIEEEA
jgi:hypothetical protein